MLTYVLITGANRGLGLQFVKKYLKRPNVVVVAGVRDTSSASSLALMSIPASSGSTVIIVKYDSLSDESSKNMANDLQEQHKITKLDLVIANAGIAKFYATTLETPSREVRDHWEVNTLGMFILFQGVWPLLEAAKSPKFVTLSTIFASIGDMEKYQYPCVAYGASKAAANYILRKIHFENPKLIAFAMHPGWVQTDQGNQGAKHFGMEKAPLTPEQSIEGIVNRIDKATREGTSGTFQGYDGVNVPW